MPDHKTVTFDASTQQGIPKVPTLDELSAFAADLVRNGDLIWAGFGKDEEERYTIPYIVPAVYKLVLAAIKQYGAPTPAAQAEGHCVCPACRDGVIHASDCAVHNAPALPVGPCDCGMAPAAQSAGREVVAWRSWHDGDGYGYWDTEDEARAASAFDFEPEPLGVIAAPVNGGEREATRCGCCGYLVTDSEHRGCLRAADAQQADRDKLHALAEKILADPQCWGWHDAARAALTSPAKVGARMLNWDSACVALNKWLKKNPSSFDDECELFRELAALASPAKVGGDERLTDAAIKAIADRYSSFVSVGVYDETRYDCTEDFYNFCRELIRAALSADGGDRKDAERYRIVRHKVCIVGDAFHIINLRPTYVAPDAGAELDAVVDAIAAKAKGE